MMRSEIGVALLQEYETCREGLDWFREQWPEETITAADGLDMLLRQERSDFIAWVLFSIPHLREYAPSSTCEALLGPRWRKLLSLFDEVRALSWLDSGQAGGRFELESLVQTHVSALAATMPGAKPKSPVTLSVVSMSEAWSLSAPLLALADARAPSTELAPLDWSLLWRAAHQAAAHAEPEIARERASEALHSIKSLIGQALWFDARQALFRQLMTQLKPVSDIAEQVCHVSKAATFARCYRRAKSCFARMTSRDAWQLATECMIQNAGQKGADVEALSYAVRTVADVARLDVSIAGLWLLADVDAPCPFTPVINIWKLGYWPVGVVDGIFVVGDPSR